LHFSPINLTPFSPQWNIEYGTLTSLVVLASGSRIESLAVLRLRLCGRQVTSRGRVRD
jgi:hypothetical protein